VIPHVTNEIKAAMKQWRNCGILSAEEPSQIRGAAMLPNDMVLTLSPFPGIIEMIKTACWQNRTILINRRWGYVSAQEMCIRKQSPVLERAEAPKGFRIV